MKIQFLPTTVLLILLSHVISTSENCIFPRWLRRMWSARLIYGFSKDGRIQYTFNDQVLMKRFIEGSINYRIEYKCTSMTHKANDVLIFTLQTISSSNEKSSCLRMQKFTDFVLQIAEGVNCNDLKVEEYLLLDKNGLMNTHRESCSNLLEGGFQASFIYLDSYDNIKRNGYTCRDDHLWYRIESECVAYSGLYFNFDSQPCLGKYQAIDERAVCKSSWKIDHFVFSIVQFESNRNEKIWLVRSTNKLRNDDKKDSFTIQLLISQSFQFNLEYKPVKMDAVYLLLQRDSRSIHETDLCMDIGRQCSSNSRICSDEQNKNNCLKTCRLCDDLGMVEKNYLLDPDYLGEWKLQSTDYNNNNNNNKKKNVIEYVVKINENSIVTDMNDTFKPIVIKHNKLENLTEKNLQQIFLYSRKRNGCSPKFACLTLQKSSTAAAAAQRRQETTEPPHASASPTTMKTLFIKMDRPRHLKEMYEKFGDPISCLDKCDNKCSIMNNINGDSNNNNNIDGGVLRSKYLKPLFKTTVYIPSVDCHFPDFLNSTSTTTTGNGNDINIFLKDNNNNNDDGSCNTKIDIGVHRHKIIMNGTDCSTKSIIRRNYTCIESIDLGDSDLKTIIVLMDKNDTSSTNSNKFSFCFPKYFRFAYNYKFYLTQVSHCNAGLEDLIRMNKLKPIYTFETFRQTTTTTTTNKNIIISSSSGSKINVTLQDDELEFGASEAIIGITAFVISLVQFLCTCQCFR